MDQIRTAMTVVVVLTILTLLARCDPRSDETLPYSGEYAMPGWVMESSKVPSPIVWHIHDLATLNDLYRARVRARGETPKPWIGGYQYWLDGVCHIVTPPVNDEMTMDILRHEVRHCTQESWHD